MTAPKAVVDLVERFSRQRQSYQSSSYNETQVRREFIDPFFKALGWDIDNERGYAEAYKDVVHEDALKIGTFTKAPDYSFRIGGTRKFFVEAKKPSVNIKDDVSPAYQLRRYAWSAKLPLSILTDFEEFAVYDCRVKPDKADKSSTARLQFFTHENYLDQWEEIYGLFSRDAVLKGSFDRYAESKKGKRGTAEVDDAFLKEIESWRDSLARNVALRNLDLSPNDLNAAVQRTIDRIIFLRIAEDRGLETYGRLQALLNGGQIYPRLREMFREADERYNSGLFHFKEEKGQAEKPDLLTLDLQVDDKPLKEILANLYYPESPYEFSVLPAEILGQVYEQFLGKVIRLTAGHRAVVEDKPEVKKAGGVYYTPKYIVDYIVKNTVGKMLEGRTPKQVSGRRGGAPSPPGAELDAAAGGHGDPLRVLDPACGSGSFLLGAYQYLLDWHRDRYVEEGAEKHAKGKAPVLYQGPGGAWRLTTAERKRILLSHIYGVDIDPQAVEVTKLSLLLKVLEGENAESLGKQLKLFHERALPDLANSIKCGNSLIGSDFYQGKQADLFDQEEIARVNAFDWDVEFPEVFRGREKPVGKDKGKAFTAEDAEGAEGAEGRGKEKPFTAKDAKGAREDQGFDVVIGNPPYVRQESLSDFKDYFQSHYEAFNGVADLYAYFIERGVRLLHTGGLYSVIVSSSFLRATYGAGLRSFLKSHAAILRLVDFGGLAVFAKAKDTYVCIPLIEKGGKQNPVEVCPVPSLDIQELDAYVAQRLFTIPPDRLSTEAWSLKSDSDSAVFAKILKAGTPLGTYVERRLFYGIKTGLNEAFELTEKQRAEILRASPTSEGLIKRFLGGQDIRRYFTNGQRRFLIVIPCGWTRRQMLVATGKTAASEREAFAWLSKEHPAISGHLQSFGERLRRRQDQGDFWWELRPCDYYPALMASKIIFPDICKSPRFALDRAGIFIANTAYCLGTDSLYLLGILNSRLFWFTISQISIPFGTRAGEYRYRLIYQYMEKVPIRVLDPSNPLDGKRHNKMVALVNRMLDLHERLSSASTDHDLTLLERQIAATDKEIDRLVYDLYGLTEDEIAIVEGVR